MPTLKIAGLGALGPPSSLMNWAPALKPGNSRWASSTSATMITGTTRPILSRDPTLNTRPVSG